MGNNAKLTRRWMIEGTLVTKRPLHIGSGETTHRDDLVNEKTKAPVKIAAVAMGSKKPYIPGSTLKGNIRAWADKCLDPKDKADIAFIDAIFGSLDPKEETSKGGKVDFFDARSVGENDPIYAPPYWDKERLTGVMTSTQINRRTRTVGDKRLFHLEYVPEGVSFKVRIGAQDTDGEAGYNEIERLLALFEGFNTDDVSLGAATGDDWGLFTWQPDDIRIFDAKIAADWVADGCKTVGYAALESIGGDEVSKRHGNALAMVTTGSTDSLAIDITLKFDGSFLVDDPSRTKKEGDPEVDPATGKKKPNHVPLLDADGRLWLPASSFRGAFRSQAERILRTIGGYDAACYPDGSGPRKTCGAISDVAEVKNLCPACQLFGSTGWRSPIQISAFKPVPGDALANGTEMHQDFVAIDRFTGGSLPGAKFDARSYYRPILSGSIEIDPDALAKTSNPNVALGLLLLTLRDLVEGDVRFGFGGSKGYGGFMAEVTQIVGNPGISAPTGYLEEIRAFFFAERQGKDFASLVNAVDSLHMLCKKEDGHAIS